MSRLRIFAEVEDYLATKKKKWKSRGAIPLLSETHLRKKKDDRIAFYYGIPREKIAIKKCNHAKGAGYLTWGHLLVEEVSEAICAQRNIEEMRSELIQIIGICVGMIEQIDEQQEDTTGKNID